MNQSFHSLIFSPRQHITAPSYTLSALLGMTRCSSMPMIFPNPSHSGHAPAGELKENMLSEGSSKVMPSASNRVLNECVSPSGMKRSIISPPPS